MCTLERYVLKRIISFLQLNMDTWRAYNDLTVFTNTELQWDRSGYNNEPMPR